MSGAGNGRAGRRGFPFAKIVVVLAIAFGVGLGLCGLSFVAASAGFKSHEEFGIDSFGIAGFSLLVMILSAAGLVPALVAWVVAATVRAWRETGEPQTLHSHAEQERQSQIDRRKDSDD